jgi:hypothetical protein
VIKFPNPFSFIGSLKMPFTFTNFPKDDTEKLDFIDSIFKVDYIKVKKYLSNTSDLAKDLNTLIEISHSLFNYRDSIKGLTLTTNYNSKILVVILKISTPVMLKKFIGIRFCVEFEDEEKIGEKL